MDKKTRFGLVGVHGYAEKYLKIITQLCKDEKAELIAVNVRNPEKYAEKITDLTSKGITVYEDYDTMLRQEKDTIDIMAIPTAIHSHTEMAVKAMKGGYDVLVEKPPAATVQEVDEMIKTSRETGKFCAVGFQWISNNALKTLREYIAEGKLGSVSLLLGKGVWKRHDSYYERSTWAGKTRHEGKWVLDGAINNPLGHYLNNLIFFGASEDIHACRIVNVRAELYKGHDIEGDDTACIEAVLDNNVKLYFYATVCGKEHNPPILKIIGSKGEVHWEIGQDIHIQYNDGTTEIIKKDDQDSRQTLFENIGDYYQGKVKTLDCPVESVRPFTLMINGAYESAGRVMSISDKYITRTEDNDSIATHITDIESIIEKAFASECLFSDLGIAWARKTEVFDLKGYSGFPVRAFGKEYEDK